MFVDSTRHGCKLRLNKNTNGGKWLRERLLSDSRESDIFMKKQSVKKLVFNKIINQ